MRASIDGTARPGHGRRHHHVNILRPQPRLIECGGDCRAAELHRVFDPDVVRLAEVGQRGVLLERQHQVATVDFGTRVELAEQIPVIPERGKPGEHVGDFILRIVMLWQDALHTRYDAAGLVGLKFVAAHGYSHVTHLSWTTLVAGTVAATDSVTDREWAHLLHVSQLTDVQLDHPLFRSQQPMTFVNSW